MRLTRALLSGGAAWWAWRVFGPEPTPRFPEPQLHPWPVAGRSVFVGAQEFFVRRLNENGGPPVLLIHGWGDHTAIIWQRIAPLLAVERDVIMVDLRNHGRSDRRRGAYEIEDVADDVAAILDQLGVDQLDVVGYSMGGMVAQSLAHRHPDRVSALVFGGTAACPAPGAWRLLTTALFAGGRALDRISRAELSAVRYAYLRRRGVVPSEHAEWLWNEQMARDPDLYWQAGFAANRFDSRPWLASLVQPSLVIIPTSDQLVLPRLQRTLAAHLADATVIELVGARHEAPLTHAREMAEAISSFLEKESLHER